MAKLEIHDVTFDLIAAELKRARAKFPGNDHLLAALVEEVGELAQAYLKGDASSARLEAIQVACVAIRIIEEGDMEFERPDYVSTEPTP